MITDTRLTIETPEGTDLPLTPAGLGARSVAYVLDFLIYIGVLIGLGIVTSFFGSLGWAANVIGGFLIFWFYPVYFEVWRKGQTPGKKYMKLLVINEDGTPITFAASTLRNLLRVVDALPAFYCTAIVCSILSNKFQRLGDIAAQTLVVYADEEIALTQANDLGYRPVPVGLTTDEQRSFLDFTDRCKKLSVDRQNELASILQPMLGSKDPVKAIKQIANTMSMGSKKK